MLDIETGQLCPETPSMDSVTAPRPLAPNGDTMDGTQFIWEHFKFNAEQRLKGFNFFVLLSIFANGGVFTAIEKQLHFFLLLLLGLFIVILALVFWLVDARSRNLLKLTIPALKEIESTFPETHRLFAIDAKEQGFFIRYTFAFRGLLIFQLLFGMGVIFILLAAAYANTALVRTQNSRAVQLLVGHNQKKEYKMFKKLAFIALVLSLLAGCASVPMETELVSAKAKSFNPPTDGNAGLYLYRSSGVGTALKKDIWVDNKCIGESAPNVFFYEEVKGNEEHKISTESEFSPNELLLKTESGNNYFIKQYIKFGVFVGGANLELIEEEEGKKDVSKLEMAKKGTCSK
jgi:hypothetical protein